MRGSVIYERLKVIFHIRIIYQVLMWVYEGAAMAAPRYTVLSMRPAMDHTDTFTFTFKVPFSVGSLFRVSSDYSVGTVFGRNFRPRTSGVVLKVLLLLLPRV